MILRLLILGALFSSMPALAEASYCKIVDEAVFQMKIAEYNIANSETTRTPEGGPYRKKVVYCGDERCEVEEVATFRKAHSPNHPNAGKDGMVQLPKINVQAELAMLVGFQHSYDHFKPLCDSEKQ